MKIGIPKEIKNNENRVGITPEGVKAMIKEGHEVLIEEGAGVGSGFNDKEYIDAGATMGSQKDVWEQEMVYKVKEPIKSEYKFFRENLILFTYLHLAAEPELTKNLMDKKVTGIAFETVVGREGQPALPLLAPMSEVAGRRGSIIAATHLESHNNGMGLLPGGVTGTDKGHFLVIGGGVAGYNSAFTAAGLGANVTILEMNDDRIKELENDKVLNSLSAAFNSKIEIKKSSKEMLDSLLPTADALISTVLIPGEKAAKVVTEEQVRTMKPGSVIVDISIDQGGSIETIDKITTHDKPTYLTHGVLHYSVANMPGATPRTSTMALSAATLPYAIRLANKGIHALTDDPKFAAGLNTFDGKCTYEGVSTALKLDYVDPETAMVN